ncbi:MAG: methyltransferase domain-containing protein [Vicinamibacterales bacterium]
MLRPPTLRATAITGFVLGLVLASAWPARGQSDADDAARLVRALGVESGSVVGEVGAGRGALTIAMARTVGPGGHVYSNELDARRRDDITRAITAAGVHNVTVVEGQPAATNMPAACCDALFMRDVFHHVADRPAMSRSLFATLTPGGRLAVLDFPPRRSHGITADEVRATLEGAGFADVRVEATGARWFLVVAARPAS